MKPELVNPSPGDLLVTKIFTPQPRAGLVLRPRLSEQLVASRGKKLILINAPAGYGKTTLLTEWFSRKDIAVAWYSLDKSDNDVGRFLSYCILALQSINAEICNSALRIIRSPDPPPIDTLLTFVINDLACLNENCRLVLDDFHLITDSQVHAALAFLLQNLPPTLQIVITSRAELPFSISSLRAKDQVLVLDQFDLRFTQQEITEFVHKFFEGNLSEDQIAVLDQRTEGWVTGLQLTALGLRRQADITRFIDHLAGDNRIIGDYLFDEVFASQPEHIQHFLMVTALFTRFSSSLCNAVLQIENSYEIIDYLEQANLFTIPLDNKRTWYRYHHLFAELLQNRLQLLNPDGVAGQYLAAAQWFEEQGFLSEAIDYALAAQEFEYTAQMLEPAIPRIVTEGAHDQVIRWLQVIPLKILRQSGYLWQYLVLTMLDKGNFQAAKQTLAQIWPDLDELDYLTPKKRDTIRGYTHALLSSITIHATIDADQARQHSHLAADLLPEYEFLGRCIAYGHNGSACLHLGRVDEAIEKLNLAMQLSKLVEYKLVYLLWFSYRAQAVAARGELVRAKTLYQEAHTLAENMGMQKSNIFSNAVIGLGNLYYEWNDLNRAEKVFEEGVSIAEKGDYLDRLLMVYLNFAQIRIALGDYAHIEDKLAFGKTVARKYNYPPDVMLGFDAIQVRLSLAKGDLHRASQWARSVKIPAEMDDLNSLIEYQLRILANVWLAAGNSDQAVGLAFDLYTLAQRQNRQRDVIQIGNTLVIGYEQQGAHQKALALLLELLQRAEADGYIRSFLDKGPVIRSLLWQLSKNPPKDIAPHILVYIGRLLQAFEAETHRLVELGIDFPEATSPQILTPREQDVIQLLAVGLSYAEIAQRLVVTENTLKTHIKNIYTKLEVNNRTQAVNKAGELGILQ